MHAVAKVKGIKLTYYTVFIKDEANILLRFSVSHHYVTGYKVNDKLYIYDQNLISKSNFEPRNYNFYTNIKISLLQLYLLNKYAFTKGGFITSFQICKIFAENEGYLTHPGLSLSFGMILNSITDNSTDPLGSLEGVRGLYERTLDFYKKHKITQNRLYFRTLFRLCSILPRLNRANEIDPLINDSKFWSIMDNNDERLRQYFLSSVFENHIELAFIISEHYYLKGKMERFYQLFDAIFTYKLTATTNFLRKKIDKKNDGICKIMWDKYNEMKRGRLDFKYFSNYKLSNTNIDDFGILPAPKRLYRIQSFKVTGPSGLRQTVTFTPAISYPRLPRLIKDEDIYTNKQKTNKK